MASSLLKRASTTYNAAAKNTLNSTGVSTQSLPQPLRDSKPFRVFAVIRTHANPHAFVEMANICEHLGWHTRACEYLPQQLSVDRVVRFL